MLKEVIEVKVGYEEIHAKLVEKKENIEAEIRRQVEAETVLIDKMISDITEVRMVEVPDELPEEQTENVEQPMY